MTTKDTIIIGGGIIGCSIALRLAESGLKVVLIERNTIGRESSWAAAGMLSAQTHATEKDAYFDLGLRSCRMYREFAEKVFNISGVDPEYRDQGTVCVALDEEGEKEIDSWAGWQQKVGLPIERLSAADLKKLEPAVSDSALGGVFLPADHQVENRRLMESLAEALKRLGVEILEGTDVRALVNDGQKCTGVVSTGGKIAAGSVVLAAGSWSGSLLRDMGLHIQVAPARGQMLALKGGHLPFTRIVHAEACYLVPRNDGRIVIGSTVEYVGFEKGVTASGISSLLDSARRIVPKLGEFEIVELWSGLRPDTTDHLPMLGPSPIDGLYLATGHFRNGIMLAPVTAEIISDCIVRGSALPEDAAPFAVDRFLQHGQ